MAANDEFLLIEDPTADRDERIRTAVRYYQVNTAVAAVMVDTGYSKGTANRIVADRRRAESRAAMAKQAKKEKSAAAA